MKVSQLIEALRHMPADAEVEAHASGHSTWHDDMRVGLLNGRVLVGNWCSYRLRELMGSDNPPESAGTIYAVRRYGHGKGELVTERVVELDEKDPHCIVPERNKLALKSAADLEEDAIRAERARQNKEASERRELERLKAKYEEG